MKNYEKLWISMDFWGVTPRNFQTEVLAALKRRLGHLELTVGHREAGLKVGEWLQEHRALGFMDLCAPRTRLTPVFGEKMREIPPAITQTRGAAPQGAAAGWQLTAYARADFLLPQRAGWMGSLPCRALSGRVPKLWGPGLARDHIMLERLNDPFCSASC